MESKILKTTTQKEYELFDSGNGEKLERFGKYILRRPDPQALWERALPIKKWQEADAFFSRTAEKGKWEFKKGVPASWQIELMDLTLKIAPTPFKHTGLFPEQFPNWLWTEEKIKERMKSEKEISVLNLFGYTGVASLVCAKAGAKVTHVDASKAAITWARENAELSELKEAPIRWILDDALDFVKKEIKRGKKYDGVIMDPPAFGRGPKGELWKIEDNFVELVNACKEILSEKPLFFLVNGYAAGFSSIAYENNIKDLQQKFGGEIEVGELAIEESGDEKRLLPAGIFARWGSI